MLVMRCLVELLCGPGSIPVRRYSKPYWTSGKNSLELIELSSINAVSLV